MPRTLAVLSFVLLTLGLIAAFFARLMLPATLLAFDYQTDPAIATIAITLLLTLILLAIAAVLQINQRYTQRALARQADALETERRRFIQRLDHELKNPLTAIQVQLDNLQAVNGDAASVAEVRLQADRLALLTRGLRRLADLETRPLQLERVEIGELLDEVVELLDTPERISLDVQKVPWAIPPIEGDRELLLIVFRNLVDNALKYSSGDRAKVQVRARHTTGALVVEVIDTGRGIPAEDLPLITEELYRGKNVRDVAGSGLGLAMVNRIVERHHGKLEVRSRSGQGTIATVQLPYDQASSR
jgi:two-component system OmpR family sensor kinase